ncbi:hypothetical protein VNO77_27746 [Canavalia gladiata]|uniref:Uncharacterized protein n=1 Tax=Canavalia gladiata TaxID=3824 RepID=A0AAN9KZF5_CANGL
MERKDEWRTLTWTMSRVADAGLRSCFGANGRNRNRLCVVAAGGGTLVQSLRCRSSLHLGPDCILKDPGDLIVIAPCQNTKTLRGGPSLVFVWLSWLKAGFTQWNGSTFALHHGSFPWNSMAEGPHFKHSSLAPLIFRCKVTYGYPPCLLWGSWCSAKIDQERHPQSMERPGPFQIARHFEDDDAPLLSESLVVVDAWAAS